MRSALYALTLLRVFPFSSLAIGALGAALPEDSASAQALPLRGAPGGNDPFPVVGPLVDGFPAPPASEAIFPGVDDRPPTLNTTAVRTTQTVEASAPDPGLPVSADPASGDSSSASTPPPADSPRQDPPSAGQGNSCRPSKPVQAGEGHWQRVDNVYPVEPVPNLCQNSDSFKTILSLTYKNAVVQTDLHAEPGYTYVYDVDTLDVPIHKIDLYKRQDRFLDKNSLQPQAYWTMATSKFRLAFQVKKPMDLTFVVTQDLTSLTYAAVYVQPSPPALGITQPQRFQSSARDAPPPPPPDRAMLKPRSSKESPAKNHRRNIPKGQNGPQPEFTGDIMVAGQRPPSSIEPWKYVRKLEAREWNTEWYQASKGYTYVLWIDAQTDIEVIRGYTIRASGLSGGIAPSFSPQLGVTLYPGGTQGSITFEVREDAWVHFTVRHPVIPLEPIVTLLWQYKHEESVRTT